MPNPIAHPAAAVPFARVGLVLSALIVGSIAPDLGYFAPLPSWLFMYTVPGLFLFDVPLGLLLLWFFHVFMKWPLLSLLPLPWQRRLIKPAQGFSFGPLRRFLLILLSLLVGSATHVIWDSFTHSYGWTVKRFPFFRVPIGGIQLYTILQHGGTLLGVALLIYWVLRWWRAAPQSDQLPARFSREIQLLFLALTVISLAVVEGGIVSLRLVGGSQVIGGYFLVLSSLFSSVLVISFFAGIYCVAWMIAFHRMPGRTPPAGDD